MQEDNNEKQEDIDNNSVEDSDDGSYLSSRKALSEIQNITISLKLLLNVLALLLILQNNNFNSLLKLRYSQRLYIRPNLSLYLSSLFILITFLNTLGCILDTKYSSIF